MGTTNGDGFRFPVPVSASAVFGIPWKGGTRVVAGDMERTAMDAIPVCRSRPGLPSPTR